MQTHTLAVFGVSGLTGQALANAALARGWAVRGLVRAERQLPDTLHAIAIVRGDLTDPTSVAAVVRGADAVCCVFGPRAPYTDAFCAPATRAIIDAMRRAGVRRLVCQTGAMVGAGNRTRVFDVLARMIARRQPAVAEDRVEQERLVQESGLDWTIVKPPRLTNAPASGDVTVGRHIRVGLLSSVSRAHVAAFMVDAIAQSQYCGAMVFLRR